MKREIDDFKKANGNVTYTTKELLQAIHTKIDRIETRLVRGDKNFSSMQTTISVHKKLLYSLYGILGGLLMLILRLTGKI